MSDKQKKSSFNDHIGLVNDNNTGSFKPIAVSRPITCSGLGVPAFKNKTKNALIRTEGIHPCTFSSISTTPQTPFRYSSIDPSFVPVARNTACETFLAQMGTIYSGSKRSSAGCRYSAGISLHSAHTGTIEGPTATVPAPSSFTPRIDGKRVE